MLRARVTPGCVGCNPGACCTRRAVWRRCGDWFFFSSRRRHTRYWRDWSSDVCSSDLQVNPNPGGITTSYDHYTRTSDTPDAVHVGGLVATSDDPVFGGRPLPGEAMDRSERSEERRVGKERRSRWSPYH